MIEALCRDGEGAENNGDAIYPTAAAVRSNVVAPYAPNANWRSNVLAEPFFNTAGFAAPALNTFGNAGRTVASGPGTLIADLSLLKDFRIAEAHRLQFRAESLNFIRNADFGLIGGNQASIIQLGLHYKF